jgi:hypothetical protein
VISHELVGLLGSLGSDSCFFSLSHWLFATMAGNYGEFETLSTLNLPTLIGRITPATGSMAGLSGSSEGERILFSMYCIKLQMNAF